MAAKPLPPAPSTVGSHPSVSAMSTRMRGDEEAKKFHCKR
ncbi:hypothetical protein OOU_Y34scaffold00199g2 [Pyricularia oryzae Y34]|uniref:Uncharacterized protein n=2 Tax=Pyricularia oryzae TaxID=318829 RepID=A0A4P7NTN2_PYROR|nr:hypothetical protein OOU_Y34scaffold00199g2 [Pyricularia oryzae Y34]QBZ65742.1 hypothetical protein PoMZ_12705 [Pyricularia oryzae]